jgi:signal transduction histidine kinase
MMRAKLLTSRSVKGAIWRIFFVVVILLIVFLAVLYNSLQTLKQLDAQLEATHHIESLLRNLGRDMSDAETSERGFIITSSPKFLERYVITKHAIPNYLSELQQQVKRPEVLAALPELTRLSERKIAEMDEVITLVQQGKQQAASDMVNLVGKQAMEEFRELRSKLLDLEQQSLTQRLADNQAHLQELFLLAVLGSGILLFGLFLITELTAARLADPIHDVLQGLVRIEQGDLQHAIEVSHQDEIGRVANKVNQVMQMLAAARAQSAQYQADLERSNAELDRFAYVASHDLKAPLRGLRSLAQWISQDITATASHDTLENLALMQNRIDRLDGLLNGLLAYSRIGREHIAATRVDSAALIENIAIYLAPPAGFSIRSEGAMPVLHTPQSPLQQVLHNLINNAIKHHDLQSGNIIVSAREQGELVEFSVADDGAGIAAAFHEKIFIMFQTLKPRDQVEGSGMGLAIVRKTVENFGGQIRVVSNPPQRGTQFIFTWPKSLAADAGGALPASQATT